MKINTLEQFSNAFGAMLANKPERDELLNNGKEMLRELVSDADWFRPILTKLVLDEAFLKSQWQSIDPNEIQIYRSCDKSFSIRAYIWEPNVTYPIHDHGAWGITGTLINQITERKYERIDDGKKNNFAKLKLVSQESLSPGGTSFVLPLNAGIHQMKATGDLTAVSIHVYGAPVRKGFINYFDLQNNFVQRMYPPAVNKKIYAIRTLGSIAEPWAEETLCNSLNSDIQNYIKTECQEALIKLRG